MIEELGVYLSKPQLYVFPKKGIKGANPSALVCDDSPISLKNSLKRHCMTRNFEGISNEVLGETLKKMPEFL